MAVVTQVQFGRIHGFGTYTWRTDSKYVGKWKEGKMHGHGIKTDPAGASLRHMVEEATGGGGSAPQCALLCAWHVWRGYTAAHGASVRHLRDVRLGRRGLAHGARAACAPVRTPASCLLALSSPPPRQPAAPPHRRIAAPPPRRQATSSRAIGRRASRSSRTPRAKTGPTYYPGSTRR